MDEYIERHKIRESYEKLTRTYVNGDPYIADWRFDEMIESLPVANVATVRHGRWERTADGAVLCTACKRKMNSSQYGYAFCSLCGAKMDGDVG